LEEITKSNNQRKPEMTQQMDSESQGADVKTPVASLDKQGKIKTGLKQELAHYKEQQKAGKAEKEDEDTAYAGHPEVADGDSVKGDPAGYNSDLSAWNWWNNARILAGEYFSGGDVALKLTLMTSQREHVFGISQMPYQYRITTDNIPRIGIRYTSQIWETMKMGSQYRHYES
jgi:hypothetical protein